MSRKIVIDATEKGYATTPAAQVKIALENIESMGLYLSDAARSAIDDSYGSTTYGESVKGIEQHHKAIGIWLARVRQIDGLADVLAEEVDDRGAYGEL